ncbi:MAG: hypothetical protein WC631_01135 [Candidatus Paceibacterota bacterium]|jgi:hypothetical protein
MRKDTYNAVATFLLVAVMLLGGTFAYSQKTTAQQPIKEVIKKIDEKVKVILKSESEEWEEDEDEEDDSRIVISQNTSVNIAPAPKPIVSTTALTTISPTPTPVPVITPISSRKSMAS